MKRELNKLIGQLQSAGDAVTLIDEALPLADRTTKLDVMLDNYAKASSMDIGQITVEETDDKKISAGDKEVLKEPYKASRKLATTTASVSISGTIDQFKNFLQLA